ncbi:MAG: hypothetical protein IKV72_01805, partial [Firmicutes bacterium]|nr:hypothetical protein [Bacillota bacterium]
MLRESKKPAIKKDKLQKMQNEMLILKISAIVGAVIGLAEIIMFTISNSHSILIDGIYDFVEV